MKNFILFVLMTVAVGFVGAANVNAQGCDPNYESPANCRFYDAGYRSGADDASRNQGSDYKRYRGTYDRNGESYFRNGYQAGYSSIGRGGNNRWNDSQKNAYDSGYSAGQSDRRHPNDRSSAQVNGNYNANIGLYYQAGYDDGFAGRSRRYNFNVGNGNGNGGGWNGGGTSSGSASWQGRVDDRANIIIQGRNIRTEDVTGTGVQTYNQNMSSSLPNRDVSVTAVKRNGRGNVTVIQQPSRYNNYTAIVQVSDTKGGSDDYQVDIAWGGAGFGNGNGNGNGGGWGNGGGRNGGNETYGSGRVIWRGRVDQTVNIRIDGGNVYSEDDSGTGLSDVNFDISGALAHRQGSVNVRKRSGRGSVYVLQQPTYENGFTAVIQISDTGSGADNYEVEISW